MSSMTPITALSTLVVPTLAVLILPQSGAAQGSMAMELQTIDQATQIQDHRGEMVPADLKLVDENHHAVKIGDYFNQGHPIILDLGYFGCPALCGVVTNAMAEAMRGMKLSIGSDYEALTVSIDPSEKPELARKKKNSYLASYPEPGVEEGWHFLTGEEDQVHALAKAVGFNYQWNSHGKQYDHSAGIFVLAPDGKVSQVLQGAYYKPRDLRFALIEASEGNIGTTWDRLLLTCYGFDPKSGTYNLMVWTVIRIGGGVTLLGLGLMIFLLWYRERRKRRLAAAVS